MIKRHFFIVLFVVAYILMALYVKPAFASESAEGLKPTIVLLNDSPNALVDEKLTKLDKSNESVKPIIKGGRTLVPLRFIGESLGTTFNWLEKERRVEFSYKDKIVKIIVGDNKLIVDNLAMVFDSKAEIISGRVFVPLRALTEAFGKKVLWDEQGIIIVYEGVVPSVASDKVKTAKLAGLLSEAIIYQEKSINTSTGTKKVRVIRVNPKSPEIEMEVVLNQNKLNNTFQFERLVKEKKAFAAINANFFSAYDKIKDPIGNVMTKGKIVYGQSGITTVGIGYDKSIIFCKPATFFKSVDNSWSAYEINNIQQEDDCAIIYTPERGDSVSINKSGYVVVVENKIVKDNYHVSAPKTVSIPKNGFLVFFSDKNDEKWHNHEDLKIGSQADYRYDIKSNSNLDFRWENTEYALSGGPDLVENGVVSPVSSHPAFAGERFTSVSTRRTAIGVDQKELLFLVTVDNATIKDLKEIMFSLGMKNAVNLDGGGSSAMYYDNNLLLKPGRELSTALFIYKDRNKN